MSTGTIVKRCGCTDPTGKRLGPKCPKLRRGDNGSWNPRHGNWAIQLELPTPDGQARRQFRRSGLDSADDAQAMLDEVRALLNLAPKDRMLTLAIAQHLLDLRRNEPLPTAEAVLLHLRAGSPRGAKIRVGPYLDQWLDDKTATLSPGTINSYRNHVELYFKPHLGDLGLTEVTTTHLRKMFRTIDDNNARILAARTHPDPDVQRTVRGVRTVGPSSKQRIRATLRTAYADAIKEYGYATYNPARDIALPSGKRPVAKAWTATRIKAWRDSGTIPGPVMVWHPTTCAEFLDYTETHDTRLYPLYALMAAWGPRRGEACGLRDVDIHLDLPADTDLAELLASGESIGAAVISIIQQRTAVAGKPIVKDVKSAAGERTYKIDEPTTRKLLEYLAMRTRWQQACGDKWPDTGFFFVQPDGQPWHPDTVTNRFEHLVAAADLPPIRLHDLRHCAASYMWLAGNDMKQIQEILGHSTIVITSDTYTTVFAELDPRATAGGAAILDQARQKRSQVDEVERQRRKRVTIGGRRRRGPTAAA